MGLFSCLGEGIGTACVLERLLPEREPRDKPGIRLSAMAPAHRGAVSVRLRVGDARWRAVSASTRLRVPHVDELRPVARACTRRGAQRVGLFFPLSPPLRPASTAAVESSSPRPSLRAATHSSCSEPFLPPTGR